MLYIKTIHSKRSVSLSKVKKIQALYSVLHVRVNSQNSSDHTEKCSATWKTIKTVLQRQWEQVDFLKAKELGGNVFFFF